jgi:hypothetical protein
LPATVGWAIGHHVHVTPNPFSKVAAVFVIVPPVSSVSCNTNFERYDAIVMPPVKKAMQCVIKRSVSVVYLYQFIC